MKRFHVHVGVADLDTAVRHYSALFGAEPTVLKPDYAKWMLDDPQVNFAISARGHAVGLHHLGIQAESPDELAEVEGRLAASGSGVLPEGRTTCCYAQSEKSWTTDPAGLLWEAFHTSGETTVYGNGLFASGDEAIEATPAACCAPR